MPETQQQRLWKLNSYRALDDTRHRLATGILSETLLNVESLGFAGLVD